MMFTTKELGYGITRIVGQGAVFMYLFEGNDKALLLDTGLGVGNIKEFVNSITNLPIEVYLTHGHLDHAGGAYHFDKVHMSLLDKELFDSNSKEYRLHYVSLIKQITGVGEWFENDICEQKPVEIIDINDGEEIDLGGRTITAISFPGHTHGSFGFYDSLSHYLVIGDCCDNSTFCFFPESTTINEYLSSLNHIKETWLPKTKELITSHDYDIVPWECFDNNIDCCERILSGKADGEAFEHINKDFDPTDVYWAYKGGEKRIDGKCGNVAYKLNKIY